MKTPRDMNRDQFSALLKARGWRFVMGRIDIGNGRSIGVVMCRKRGGFKIDRRASIAKAIRESETQSVAA